MTEDERTRGVVEADQFLKMSRREAKEAVRISSDAEYERTYRALEEAVIQRDRAELETGVRASIVVKKRGTPVADASQFEEP